MAGAVRKTLAASIMIVCALALPMSASASARNPTTRPNIVLVVVDDAGFMDFGAYGGDARTPTIDGLATRGTALSRYYTSPQCAPSRAMLLTGMDNHSLGIGSIVEMLSPEMRGLPAYSMRLRPAARTLAEVLQDAGYFTFASGKWGIGEIGQSLPDKNGFERSYVLDATGADNWQERPYLPLYSTVEWFEDGKPTTRRNNDYSSKFIVDRAIEYLDQAAEDRPVFAYVAFQAIHIPIQAPTADIDRYNGTFDQGWDKLRAERFARAKAAGLVPQHAAMPAMPASARKWASLDTGEQAYAARAMQVNAAMMEAMDRELGRLLAHLEALGRLDNTIIVVTSDNGPEYNDPANASPLFRAWMAMMGITNATRALGGPDSLSAIGSEWAASSSIPFSLYKFHSSEGGLRVPLIIAGHGVPARGFVAGRSHVFDVMPTLLALAGIDGADPTGKAPALHGRDLSPLLRGESTEVYRDDEGTNFEVGGNAAHYEGDWKIRRMPPPQGTGKWELYDLASDPGETENLADREPERTAGMIAAYHAYAQRVGVYDNPDYSPLRQVTINNLKAGARNYPLLTLMVTLVTTGLLLAIGFITRRVIRALRARRTALEPTE
ncbi:arylsulfatase [Erythrobacter sp.]|uniref:arylsulfatase n=1 Tax=Erythrobacter sp. TaxID=1042 RepID=UPI00311D6535